MQLLRQGYVEFHEVDRSSRPDWLDFKPPVQFETNLALRKYVLNRPQKLNALDDPMIALLRKQVEVRWSFLRHRLGAQRIFLLGMGSVPTYRDSCWHRSWTCFLRWRRCC